MFIGIVLQVFILILIAIFGLLGVIAGSALFYILVKTVVAPKGEKKKAMASALKSYWEKLFDLFA